MISLYLRLDASSMALITSQLTEALALVGGAVNEDLGRDDVAKRYEHLHELTIAELLGQVVDEEVAAFRS